MTTFRYLRFRSGNMDPDPEHGFGVYVARSGECRLAESFPGKSTIACRGSAARRTEIAHQLC